MKAMRVSAILLAAALVLTLLLSPVMADKANASGYNAVYVDASRPNDDGDGLSWATAKKYIQSGINIVKNDGTVYVAAGVYKENIHIGRSYNLSGAGAPNTIIDGRGLGRAVYISSYLGQTNTLSGFTIQNGSVGMPPPPLPLGPALQGPGMPVGGGVYVGYGHVAILNDCTIRNNAANFMGGGIYNAGELTLNRCTVSGNSATMAGGGIANFIDAPGGVAAGINVLNGKMTLTNCTVSGNSVTGPSKAYDGKFNNTDSIPSLSLGGGIYNGGTADFLNVTMANNSVPVSAISHGGGFANVPLQCTNEAAASPYATAATFKNTLVANNLPDNGYNYGGTVTSHGYNLDSQDTCGFHAAGDQVNTNPQLGTLQDNGGPTLTHAITAGSPAFNRGTGSGAPSTDQRGVARPQAGGFDTGAFEVVVLAPTVTSGSLNQGNQGQCPLTVIITGTNFNGATTVSFGAGITVISFVVNSDTQITATICIAGGTPPGARNISVTNPVGTGTGTALFTVVPQNQSTGGGSSPTAGTAPPGYAPPVIQPTVAVQSASISAKTVTPGTPVTVTADLVNRGTVNGNKKVTLYVNGQVETTQGVTINSGSTSKLTFNLSRSEPGDYTVYVDGVPAGSFKVELFSGTDGVLVLSVTLVAMAFVLGMVMLWRRQRTGIN